MTKSERRRLRTSELALSVGSLLASLGASLGVVPDHALAQSTSTDTSTTASASTTSSTGQQAAITTSAQQMMYQREAAWRGDGAQPLASMYKYAPRQDLIMQGVALSQAEVADEANRRTALLNQGMTLTDLQKADAALQAEAAARAPNDPAAQGQILRDMARARIVDYDFSTGSSAQGNQATGMTTKPTTPYELVLKQVMPTAAYGKTPIDADTDMEVRKRVDMLKSGMSYQQVLDAQAQQDAKLRTKAAAQTSDPAAQAKILQQLKHNQLVQYLWDHLPPGQHYQFLLELIAEEPPGGLTPLQLETEAVKRMTMLNGGMSYVQVLAALDAERQAIQAQLMAQAAALLAQQQNQTSSSSQTTSTDQGGGNATTTQGQPTGSAVIVSTNTNATPRIFICK